MDQRVISRTGYPHLVPSVQNDSYPSNHICAERIRPEYALFQASQQLQEQNQFLEVQRQSVIQQLVIRPETTYMNRFQSPIGIVKPPVRFITPPPLNAASKFPYRPPLRSFAGVPGAATVVAGLAAGPAGQTPGPPITNHPLYTHCLQRTHYRTQTLSFPFASETGPFRRGDAGEPPARQFRHDINWRSRRSTARAPISAAFAGAPDGEANVAPNQQRNRGHSVEMLPSGAMERSSPIDAIVEIRLDHTTERSRKVRPPPAAVISMRQQLHLTILCVNSLSSCTVKTLLLRLISSS